MSRLAWLHVLHPRRYALWKQPGSTWRRAKLEQLAEVYCLQERYVEAEPMLERALSLREKALVPDHVDFAKTLNAIAKVPCGQGR
jgi:hypothetical protein